MLIHKKKGKKVNAPERHMINLVSRRESKNNFDSGDVLTGQVNFGTTKGAFLHFFFQRDTYDPV